MKRKTIIRLALAVILLLAACFAFWVNTACRADGEALAMLVSDAEVKVQQTETGWLFDGPAEETALVFYPGGMVEARAYAPLLHRLAAGGVDVFLVRMPLNLAVFGMNRADKVMRDYDYAHWYIGGHSLGGAVAALFASSNGARLEGLVLCAAYATKALPDELTLLRLYGSEDGVLNMKRYEKSARFDTANTGELVIVGGNHAQFGNYGAQRGDGEAAIPAEEQQEQAAAFILQAIAEN